MAMKYLDPDKGTIVVTAVNGLTASATQTRAGALALTEKISRITTSATSGNAVKLPPLSVGDSAIVFNAGASPISVFPYNATDAIDGGTAGAAVAIANALRAVFFCVAQNVIVSAQLGAVSA